MASNMPVLKHGIEHQLIRKTLLKDKYTIHLYHVHRDNSDDPI